MAYCRRSHSTCPSQSPESRRLPWAPQNGARSSLPPAPVHAQLRRAHRRGRWDGAHRDESARAARRAFRDEEAARSTPFDDRIGSASGAAMERGERCELRSGSALSQLEAPGAEDGRVCCGSPSAACRRRQAAIAETPAAPRRGRAGAGRALRDAGGGTRAPGAPPAPPMCAASRGARPGAVRRRCLAAATAAAARGRQTRRSTCHARRAAIWRVQGRAALRGAALRGRGCRGRAEVARRSGVGAADGQVQRVLREMAVSRGRKGRVHSRAACRRRAPAVGRGAGNTQSAWVIVFDIRGA